MDAESDLPSDPRSKAAKNSSLTCVRFTSPEDPIWSPRTNGGLGVGSS